MTRILLIIVALLLLGGCDSGREGRFYTEAYFSPTYQKYIFKVREDVPHNDDITAAVFDTYEEARKECDRLNGASHD